MKKDKLTSNGEIKEKKLSFRTLRKVFLNWLFFNGCSQSGERMQGIAFAQSMSPAIKELYGDDKEEVKNALKRHLTLFNVEPQIGAIIPGITVAMEEQRANGVDVDDDTINTIKVALMGPLSGIGDTLVSGTIVPILLAICIGITQTSGALGPITYLILYPLITVSYMWFLFKNGYKSGLEGVHKIISSGTIDALTSSLNILGLLVLGALSAGYIGLSTPLTFTSGDMTLVVQDIIDNIMPNLLPLGLAFFTYYLLSVKKKTPIFVMLMIFVVAAIGTIIGVF